MPKTVTKKMLRPTLATPPIVRAARAEVIKQDDRHTAHVDAEIG